LNNNVDIFSQRERACSEEKKGDVHNIVTSKKKEAKINLEKEFVEMTAFLNQRTGGEVAKESLVEDKENKNCQEAAFLKRVAGMLDSHLEEETSAIE